MRTPKIEALYRLIDWLNARSTDNIKLPKLGSDNSSLGMVCPMLRYWKVYLTKLFIR